MKLSAWSDSHEMDGRLCNLLVVAAGTDGWIGCEDDRLGRRDIDASDNWLDNSLGIECWSPGRYSIHYHTVPGPWHCQHIFRHSPCQTA